MLEPKKKESLSISRDRSEQLNLDFEALRELGLDWMQRLSGDIWTDYNIHDPGVTILENLCFGLLDLGYRTEFDIEDLIFADSKKNALQNTEKINKDSEEQAFHLAEQIFPSNPITLVDYRKLILDQVKKVKNVWIEPISLNEVGIELKGLYQIYIQLDEVGLNLYRENTDEEFYNKRHELYIQQVWQVLERNRNLCERFLSVNIPEHLEICIYADLKVVFTAEEALVKAEIFFKLHQFIRNNIRRYSKANLEEEGQTLDEIFEGPEMENGFIKTSELRKLSSTFILAELKELISNVKDVIEVLNFGILVNGVSRFDETITFGADQFPVLNIADSTINIANSSDSVTLYKSDEKEASMVKHYLSMMIARAEKGYYPKLEKTKLIHEISKSKEEIKQYHSIQRLFPAIYGIGENGLGAYVNRKDVVAAKQLKSYLLIFEQIMADYLAQLANAPELFSLNKNHKPQSYYTQNLENENVPDLNQLFVSEEKDLKHYHTKVAHALKKREDYYLRRNQFLDHLLARFGEEFPSALLEVIEYAKQEKEGDKNQPPSYDEILTYKAELLRNYSQISRDKSRAEHYRVFGEENSEEGKPPVHRSGAFDKMRKLLLLKNNDIKLSDTSESEGFYWVENLLLYPHQDPKYIIRLLDKDGNKLLESEGDKSFDLEKEPGNKILFYGVQTEGENPKYWKVQQSDEEETEAYHITLEIPQQEEAFLLKSDSFDSESNANEQLQKIFSYLKNAKSDDIGRLSSLFEITLEKGRKDVIDKTGGAFFNHRISMVFPAWGERFSRSEFQKYVEETAYECLPAHLVVDLFWIEDLEKMKAFEETYEAWIEQYQKRPRSEKELDEKATALIETLQNLRKEQALQ